LPSKPPSTAASRRSSSAGIAFSFAVLRVGLAAVQALARRAPRVRSTSLRLAIGNIHRPGALTPSVVLSLGLGLTLLVALALIDGNLRQQISGNLPERAQLFLRRYPERHHWRLLRSGHRNRRRRRRSAARAHAARPHRSN
jgi:hypothetical protein